MEVLEAIHTRRSIREFENKAIPPEILKKIVAAAMAAPSAGNAQPWEFIVLTDKKVLGQVPALNPYAQMAAKAPAAVLVCGKLAVENTRASGWWTAAPPPRTCCWRPTVWAWGPCGPASIPNKSAWTALPACLACRTASQPTPWWSWAIRLSRCRPRSGSTKSGSTATAGNPPGLSGRKGLTQLTIDNIPRNTTT